MSFDAVHREPLRHNPTNAVTVVVERVTDVRGGTRVRKELRRPDPNPGLDAGAWAASTQPRHWNYWRREVEVYRSEELAASLRDTGLEMPRCEIEEHEDGATLWLEDVVGTAGTGFAIGDHVALAESVGRWQARPPLDVPWGSRSFLRDYSGSRAASWQLVDDDAAWRQPLIADNWPPALRDGWRRMLANRETLLGVMEGLPRTHSHLDLWVSNEIRRSSGLVVLLDWAFMGDGAIGEDLGNHIPDAVFDLFWPAERLSELDAVCFDAYLSGLHAAGWRGDDRAVRLGVVASCVKYAWLLPRMLEAAAGTEHRAYHQTADSGMLYRQRGLALQYLVGWCDEALRLADR